METTFTEAQQKRITDAGGIVLETSQSLLHVYNLKDRSSLIGITNLKFNFDSSTELNLLEASCKWYFSDTLKETSFWFGFPSVESLKNIRTLNAAGLGIDVWIEVPSGESWAILPCGLLLSNDAHYEYSSLPNNGTNWVRNIQSGYKISDIRRTIDFKINGSSYSDEDIDIIFSTESYVDCINAAVDQGIAMSRVRVGTITPQNETDIKPTDQYEPTQEFCIGYPSLTEAEVDAFRTVGEVLLSLGSWMERIAERIDTN